MSFKNEDAYVRARRCEGNGFGVNPNHHLPNSGTSICSVSEQIQEKNEQALKSLVNGKCSGVHATDAKGPYQLTIMFIPLLLPL